MANSLIAQPVVNVSGLGTLATTTTSSNAQCPLAQAYSIVLDVSSVTGTSPTYDIVMQTSWDKGTTYVNCPLRSAQITSAGIHWNTFQAGPSWGEAANTQAGVADTGGAVNKNFIFDPAYVKFKVTVGGTNPSAVVKIHIFSHPIGRVG